MVQGEQLERPGQIPVMMTTLPATLGPLGATLVRGGTELPASWSPMAWTRRLADSDIVARNADYLRCSTVISCAACARVKWNGNSPSRMSFGPRSQVSRTIVRSGRRRGSKLQALHLPYTPPVRVRHSAVGGARGRWAEVDSASRRLCQRFNLQLFCNYIQHLPAYMQVAFYTLPAWTVACSVTTCRRAGPERASTLQSELCEMAKWSHGQYKIQEKRGRT